MQWLVTLLRRRRRREQALEQILQAQKKAAQKKAAKTNREVNVDHGVEMEPVGGSPARCTTASEDGESEERRGFLSMQTSILANKYMPEEIEEDAGHWYSDSEFVRELPDDVYSAALMTRVHRKRVALVAVLSFGIAFSGLLLVEPPPPPPSPPRPAPPRLLPLACMQRCAVNPGATS